MIRKEVVEDEITEEKGNFLAEQAEKKKIEEAKIAAHNKSLLVGISAIFLYGITSLAQTVFNKKVLATYP